MKKIILICPYFGQFPNYFSLVLQSMRNNPSIDWLIFTDNNKEYNYPQNVRVVRMSFSELKDRIKSIFPYEVKVLHPYKLCDYKPFYGEIFHEEIRGYDFWGHCDFDCIFGNLRKFLSDTVLNSYSKIFFLGHLSLYANIKEISCIAKNAMSNNDVKMALQIDASSFQLDEIMMPGQITDANIEIYNPDDCIADICCTRRAFHLCKEKLIFDNGSYSMDGEILSSDGMAFSYSNGELLAYYLENGIVKKHEYAYVHLQKRAMSVRTDNDDKFIISPNVFSNWREINKDFLQRANNEPLIYGQHFRMAWHYRIDPLIKKVRIWFYRKFK